MRHPRAEQDHAEIDGVLYGSDERAERIELDEFRKKGGWIYRLGAVPCCSVMVRPLSRRSGCVPAWPYPPLRSVEVYPNPAPPRRAGRGKVQKKPLTVSSAFIYGAGIFAGSRLQAGSL